MRLFALNVYQRVPGLSRLVQLRTNHSNTSKRSHSGYPHQMKHQEFGKCASR